MEFWDVIFILLGTIISQIYKKNNEVSAPFMSFLKAHLSLSESALAKLEECIIPLLGLVLILFFVHPQDAMAQITSGAAWNMSISTVLNKLNKKNG